MVSLTELRQLPAIEKLKIIEAEFLLGHIEVCGSATSQKRITGAV